MGLLARRSAAAGLLVASLGGGCLIPTYDVEGNETSTSSTGGSTGSTGRGGAAPSEACPSETVPPPPEGDPGGDQDRFFGLRRYDIGDLIPGYVPGLDLDGVCSGCAESALGCAARGVVCTPPPFANANDAPDFGAGVDNVLLPILTIIGSPKKSIELESEAFAGSGTLGIRLWDYNGGDDDPEVKVALMVLGPRVSPPPPASGTFDGSETWAVNELSVLTSATEPRFVSSTAYVTGGILVAHIEPTLNLGAALPFPIPLRNGLLRAEIVKSVGYVALRRGVLAGFVTTDDIFTALSVMSGSNDDLCIGSVFYDVVKSTLCCAADVTTNAPGDLCNAVSVGLEFEADSIKLSGDITPFSYPSSACEPEYDPKNDSCDDVNGSTCGT